MTDPDKLIEFLREVDNSVDLRLCDNGNRVNIALPTIHEGNEYIFLKNSVKFTRKDMEESIIWGNKLVMHSSQTGREYEFFLIKIKAENIKL